MRVAAIQMRAKLADLDANLRSAERLVGRACDEGAELVVLPEFFATGMGFHPAMLDAIPRVDGTPLALLKDLARSRNVPVGGSFVALRGADAYNVFVLAFPDGSTFWHDKDQPTMWENCYFVGGSDDGVLETPLGRIGAALCWEFLRSRTVKRMLGRIDLLLGGSCWWTIPETYVPGFSTSIHERMYAIAQAAPVRMAGLLGVPVIHAGHAGEFTCDGPWVPGFRYSSYCVGETKIVDQHGKVLVRLRREDGEGVAVADVALGQRKPLEKVPDQFWIHSLPTRVRLIWWYQNLHGRHYYRRTSRPYWHNRGLIDYSPQPNR